MIELSLINASKINISLANFKLEK